MDNEYQDRWKRFVVSQIFIAFVMTLAVVGLTIKMAAMGLWGAMFVGIPLFSFCGYLTIDWLLIYWKNR